MIDTISGRGTGRAVLWHLESGKEVWEKNGELKKLHHPLSPFLLFKEFRSENLVVSSIICCCLTRGLLLWSSLLH